MKKLMASTLVLVALPATGIYAGSQGLDYVHHDQWKPGYEFTPPHAVPDHVALHRLHKAMGHKKNSITFGAMGDLNYKGQSNGDDFSGNSRHKFYIGALQFDSVARLLGWLSITGKGSYIQRPQNGNTARSLKHHFKLDDARIVAGNTADIPFSFTAGYQYLPFGTYHPYSLTGSLNKELEEAQNTILALSYNEKNFYTEFYFYGRRGKVNGESRRLFPVGENYGVKGSYSWHGLDSGFQASLSYLNNFREVSAISYLRPRNLKRIGAMASHVNFFYNHYGLLGDYTFATGRFNQLAMSFDNKGASPQALSGEAYVRFHLAQLPSSFGVGYGHSWSALALQMASHRFFSNYAVLFNKHISMQLQYAISHDYKTSNTAGMNRGGSIFTTTGTGRLNHTFQAQLSFALGDEYPSLYSELHDGGF